jgi:hypothetical protein
MISSERPSPFGQRPYERPYAQSKPPVNEDTIRVEQLQIERKTFFLTLKENARGRFLRISEESGGKRNSIMIPSTGLDEFQKLLQALVKTSNELPPRDS